VHRSEFGGPTGSEVLKALGELDAIRKSVAVESLETSTVHFSEEGRWTTTGASKRKIVDMTDPIG
jgi:hypothetical protein